MKTYTIWEGSSVYDELKENHAIEVGDIISYISYNQTGCAKYKVILNNDGEKDLVKIEDYHDWMKDENIKERKRNTHKNTMKENP